MCEKVCRLGLPLFMPEPIMTISAVSGHGEDGNFLILEGSESQKG